MQPNVLGFEASYKTKREKTHRQVKFDRVNWYVKGPGKLVLPQGLQHHLEQVLQLIGLALWPGGIDVLWGRGIAHLLGLPLAAAAAAAAAATARHLRCIQTVPHSKRVGLRPQSWSLSCRGRGRDVGRTPVQSWPRHRLH